MRALLDFYPGDQTAVLIANVAVQITGVVLLAWLLSRLVVRRNPAAHYVIWLCALGCVALGPLAAWSFQQTQWSLVRLPLLPPEENRAALTPQSEEDGTTVGSFAPTAAPHASPDASGVNSPSSQQSNVAATVRAEPPMSWADRVRAVLGGLVVVWICGAAVLIARLAWGWRSLIVLRRDLVPLDPRKLGDLPGRVRRALGVDVLPRIATCDRLASPISLGVFRRVVVLPTHLPWGLDARQLQDVLVHECAHIVRRDHAVGLLQRLVHVVFWPHPLIYLLGRELARAREEVCDNFVIGAGDVLGYARTLLRLSEGSSPGRSAMAAIGILQPRCPLEDRVAGLLDKRRKLVTQISRLVLLPVGLAFLAAVAIVAGTRIVAAVAEETEVDPACAATESPRLDEPLGQPDDEPDLVPAANHVAEDDEPERFTATGAPSLGRVIQYAKAELDRGLRRVRSWKPSQAVVAWKELGGVPSPVPTAGNQSPEVSGSDGPQAAGGLAQHRPMPVPRERKRPRPEPSGGGAARPFGEMVPLADHDSGSGYPAVETAVVPEPGVEETSPLWSMVRVDDHYSVSRVTTRSRALTWQDLEFVTIAGLDWSFSQAHDVNRLFVGLYVTNVGRQPLEFDPAAVRLMFRCGRAQPVPVEIDYADVGGLDSLVILPGQSEMLLFKNVRIESFDEPKYLALVGEALDGRAFELAVPREERYGVSFQYRFGREPWPVSPEIECRLVEPEPPGLEEAAPAPLAGNTRPLAETTAPLGCSAGSAAPDFVRASPDLPD